MTTSRKVFIASLLAGIGGWFSALPAQTFSDINRILTPDTIGSLCLILAAVLAPSLVSQSIKDKK